MSRKYLLFLTGITAALALSGCGGNDAAQTETPTEAAVTEAAAVEMEEAETEFQDALEPITPSDYLIENISEYVTPGELEGLEATQYLYEITDDMVQEEIQAELESYGEETEVERAAAEGDIIYADVTSTIHGESDSAYTESTYVTLGDEEYGADFDKELTGASSGDELTFTISFDSDSPMEEWDNKAVDFEVTVTSVCEVSIPEYSDEYVSEYMGYSTTEEYEEAVREMLTSQYEESSYADVVETLFQTAVDNSTFNGYPEELYEQCKDEVLSLYGMFLGTTDEQEIYDAFDLTESDIETEVLSTVNRRLLISAICEENNIEVTEEDYNEFVSYNAEYYGYSSAADFETDNTRESLVWAMYENEAAGILYDSANITPVQYDELAEDEYFDEDEFDEEVLDEDELVEDESIEDELVEETTGVDGDEEAAPEDTEADGADAAAGDAEVSIDETEADTEA